VDGHHFFTYSRDLLSSAGRGPKGLISLPPGVACIKGT
jgi:hypothetical protein